MTALPVHDTFSSDYAEKYIKQDQGYIESVAQEFDQLQKWHIMLFSFLESRREPLLLKASQTYRQIKDGTQGIHDVFETCKNLQKYFRCQIEFQHKAAIFDTTVHSSANKCPSVTHTAQSDPSLLQLASFVSTFYESSRYNEEAIQELDSVLTEFKDARSEHPLDDVFTNIGKFEDQKKYADERLLKFQKMIQVYQRKQHDFKSLTLENKERGGDLFLCRQKYCKAILTAWKYHMRMCRYVNDQIDVILKANNQRQQWMSRNVKKLNAIMLKYHTTQQHAFYQCHSQQQYAYVQAHQYTTATGFFTSCQPLEPPLPPQIECIPSFVVLHNQQTYDPHAAYSQLSASAAVQPISQQNNQGQFSPTAAQQQQYHQQQQQQQTNQHAQQTQQTQPNPDFSPVDIKKNQYNIPQAPKVPLVPEDYKSNHTNEFMEFYATSEQAENPFGEEYVYQQPEPPQQQPSFRSSDNLKESNTPPQYAQLNGGSANSSSSHLSIPNQNLNSETPPVIAARPKRPAPTPQTESTQNHPNLTYSQSSEAQPHSDYYYQQGQQGPYPAPAPLPIFTTQSQQAATPANYYTNGTSMNFNALNNSFNHGNINTNTSAEQISLFVSNFDYQNPTPGIRIRQFNLTPHAIKVNTTIEPKPAPQSAKSLFAKFKFDGSLEDIIKRSRRIPPPGAIPIDSTILMRSRVTKKASFKGLEGELIYTKSHQLHFIKDKVRKTATFTGKPRPPMQAGDDDDDFDYDQYVKTFGEIELTFDGPFCCSRQSRKEHNRLVVVQVLPGKFTFDKEFKAYMLNPHERDGWVDVINANNKFDPKYAPKID